MKRPPSAPQLTAADLIPHAGRVSWTDLEGSRQVILTYSGRAAIYQYLNWLRLSGAVSDGRDTVLVPSFHCPNIVDPVLHAGFRVRFFAVDERLQADSADFLRKLDRNVAAAVFIQYFGFPCMPAELVAVCRGAGVRVVEDCSHSFMFDNPLRLAASGVDATTFSFWKLLPGQAGGGLLLAGAYQELCRPRLSRPRFRETIARHEVLLRQLLEDEIEWVSSRVRRDSGSIRGEPAPAPAVRRPASEAYPYDTEASDWKMPLLSRYVLKNADLRAVASARRRNYETYLAHLKPSSDAVPVFAELPPQVCPWGLPVLLERRCERDYLIRAAGVPLFTFGEILHPLLLERQGNEVRMLERARYLSDQLIVFSVHQGLGASQIGTLAKILGGVLDDTRASWRAGASSRPTETQW